MRLLLAWLVHLYTALGAAVAVFTLALAAADRYREALALMGLALILDATDGTFARAARVKELVPRVDGARLDDIVDYLNYVLVPCFLLLWADLLPAGHGWWIVCLPLLASAYGFSQTDAKTADHHFLGFPSYWNVVAFYCFVLDSAPWFNALVVIVLSVMVFVPIRYLYPSRNTLLQGLHHHSGCDLGGGVLRDRVPVARAALLPGSGIVVLPRLLSRAVVLVAHAVPRLTAGLTAEHRGGDRRSPLPRYLHYQDGCLARWFQRLVAVDADGQHVGLGADLLLAVQGAGQEGLAPLHLADGGAKLQGLPRGVGRR